VSNDQIDDRIEAKTGEVIGSVSSRMKRTGAAASSPGSAPAASPEASIGRDELRDGLTPEQRRMLDNL